MEFAHAEYVPVALVIDDDPYMRLLARYALVEANLRVEEAGDGETGLAMIQQLWPDIVLLDVVMPGMDGFAACRELRAMPGGALIPVLMLTGLDDTESIHQAYEAGATDFITKPAVGPILGQRVRYMLNASRTMQNLIRSEAKLANAQRIASVGSWDWDIEANRISWSAEMLRLCGIAPHEHLQTYQGFLELVHPMDRQLVDSFIQAALAHGTPYSLDHRILRPDGVERSVHGRAEIIPNLHGKPVALHGTLQDVTERKQIESELRRSKARLREVAAYQDRLKEEERTRIAREIHDELGGLLTGIKSYLSFAIEAAERAGQSPDPHLVETCKLADSAIDTVRRVITDLRPSVLDQLGLWAALDWYANQIETRTGLTCSVTVDAAAMGLQLDSERSTALFRITQEALTNVVRHAQATAVAIEVERQDAEVVIRLRDDGIGIVPSSLISRESWGIAGMYERARYFGGELSITGTGGQGTTVVLRMPIGDEHDG